MKPIARYLFSTLFALFCLSTTVQAQSMKVSGTQVIKAGETLTLNAGQVVEFEPGAILQVEGNLQIIGSASAPVVFKSSNPDRPGLGILISGISESGKISVSQAQFQGLVQALRFDPFWYRSTVDLNNISISGSNSGEPVIYVSKPLLDLRDGMDIQFTAKNLEARNNASGFLFESIGADGIVYRFDNFLFQENHLLGSDASMGVLHLEAARPMLASQLNIGNMAFNRNYAGSAPVGISVGGGLDDIRVGTLYQGDASESVVYDRSSNSRIPRVVVDKMESMAAYKGSAASDYVVGANHRFGRISLAVVGNPSIVRLQDSLGRPVFNNSERIGDSLILTYLEGNPVQATLNTGALVFIPKLTAAQLPPPIYRHVDTTLISPIWPDTTATGFYGKGDGKARVRFNVDLTVPVFKSKGEQLVMLKQWEVGAFYGIGWYMGDLVPVYYPLPSSLEYSKALFANYHWNNRLTLKTSLYNTTISFHNVMSPALFSRGFIPFGFDANGDRVDALRAGATTHDVMFITPMYMIDEELKWNLRSNMIKEGKKARLVPSLGLGLGLMQYTPYRVFYYRGPFYGQETFNEFKRDVYKYKINLRKAGTEGQNFLPGSKRYSPFTTNLSASFGLNYNRRKWSWIGEVRANVTHSDYLDDFGNGLWYGGDYERFLAAFPSEVVNVPEIWDYRTTLTQAFVDVNSGLAPNSPRNGNVANNPWPFKNDGYLQFHMGIAYHLY